MQKHVLDAEDAAVGRERDFGVVRLPALLGSGKEMLEPVFDPFDRAVEFHRRPRDDHFLGVEQHDLRPKAAADERRDHPHLPFAQTEHAGEAVAQEHRRLSGVPYCHLIGARVPVGDYAPGLHRHRRAVIVEKAAADDVLGASARGGIIAAALPDMRCEITRHIVVDRSGRIRQRLFQIDNGRQRIEIDGDIAERILGEVAALRQNHRQGFADMAHFILGERHLRALVEGNVLDRRRRHEQRAGSPILAEVVGGVDGDDAVARPRGGYVDRTNPGMRDVAAQKSRVEHPGQLDVVDEQRLAVQQSRVFVASDGSAEISRRHAHYLRSRSAASSMASTMC